MEIEISIKGIILSLIVIALMIGLINSASGMYAGESYSFETNLTNPVYTVTGNSSSLDGLNITFEGRIITISTIINYKPDNFTLIFFNNLTNEVEKVVYRGGGGSTRYVDRNVTVYIPIQNNTIEEVKVEKIIDNETILETGYKLWHIGLMGLICLVFGGLIIYNWRAGDGKETD